MVRSRRGAQSAKQEGDQCREAIGVEDVARPQQDEDVHHAEREQQQVARIIALHHHARPRQLRGAVGQDHHPGAEQHLEHAARGAVGDHLAQPPGDLVLRGPAEMPDIVE